VLARFLVDVLVDGHRKGFRVLWLLIVLQVEIDCIGKLFPGASDSLCCCNSGIQLLG